MRPSLKAYSFEDYDDCLKIVFARSEAGARGMLARLSGQDFHRCQVDAHPRLDKYAPGPVTHENLINEGWWVTCWGCERRVEDDGDDQDDDGEPVGPWVASNGFVYCGQKCLDEQMGRWARVKVKKEQVVISLLTKLPLVKPLHPWVGGTGHCECFRRDHENVCVHFKVPGGGLSEKVNDDNAPNSYCLGCDQVVVCRGDIEAFRSMKKNVPLEV